MSCNLNKLTSQKQNEKELAEAEESLGRLSGEFSQWMQRYQSDSLTKSSVLVHSSMAAIDKLVPHIKIIPHIKSFLCELINACEVVDTCGNITVPHFHVRSLCLL